MGRAELTVEIKRLARELGFSAVGISPVSRIPSRNLEEWLRRGFHGRMTYLERNVSRRLDPAEVLNGARSVVSVALNYFYPYSLSYGNSKQGVISRYAAGQDYHRVVADRLRELLRRIREAAPGVEGKVYVDTGPVMDKTWAARSGIGWLGKHTNVLAKGGLGSWFFIGEILLDRDLESDEPATDHCGSCRACIDACPTDAITEPYVLDSRRCISYLTIELKEDIPEEFRPAMGNLIFGCDICQDVCPWNRKATGSSVAAFEPLRQNRNPALADLAGLDREEFAFRYRGSPIKRPKWKGFMRNVAVAMGNSGDTTLVPMLSELLQCDEPLVRRHAAWSIVQLGSPGARDLLRSRLSMETDPETRKTLESLLARLSSNSGSTEA